MPPDISNGFTNNNNNSNKAEEEVDVLFSALLQDTRQHGIGIRQAYSRREREPNEIKKSFLKLHI